MTTTSATSTIISALGSGSGIDMSALATSLASAQFSTRIARNQSQADTVDRQISGASALKSQVLQLASSVADRVRTGDLSSQPQIANAAAAQVSKGTQAGSGSYSLEVSTLAAGQVLDSVPFASASTPVGSGSLTIRFGTVAGGAFSEDTSHGAVSVNIASGATLNDVAAAINAAKSGVTATVLKAADGAHLVLKGATGAANGFTVEASEASGDPGLASLAWTLASAPARLLSGAADAAYKLDGVAMTSASNTIADVAPGLNLTLTGTNPGAPTRIGFSDPASAVTTFMNDLTAALNELVAELNKDADPKNGDLARDSGARALRTALVQLAGSTVMPNAAAQGLPSTLADLGLATNRDGTFRLDTNRLSATLKASPSGAAAMMTNGIYGVYATIDRLSRKVSSITDPGSLAGSLSRLDGQKTKLAKEKTDLADAQEKLRARLATQFAGVDTRVGASKSTLSFLQNQVALWQNQKN